MTARGKSKREAQLEMPRGRPRGIQTKNLLCLRYTHLFGRQESPDRVIDEVELQTRVGLTISERVEHHETLDAAIENPAASLHVHVLR